MVLNRDGIVSKPYLDFVGPPVFLFSASLISPLDFIISLLWVFSFILIFKFLS